MEKPTWGHVDPGELERIVVISPHFDDAAMGADQMLIRHAEASATTVLTLFGGAPPAYPDPPTDWDAWGGFGPGDDVVAHRREEDRAAMEVLGARSEWLQFCEHQYLPESDRPTPADVAPVLEAAVVKASATAVFIPMGLANPDHDVAHQAGLLVRERLGGLAWFCYEDQGYKHLPGLLAWRVAKLFRSLVWPTPEVVPVAHDLERKRRAIWCYASQIPPLEREHGLTTRLEADVPEQFWRLAPPPPGWEGMVDL